MSVNYMEEHDVCFWKKEFVSGSYSIDKPKFAWADWGLIPTARPYISTPKANYTIAQIPNSSDRINITDYMPGGMTYESRTGEWQFAIDHSHPVWKTWFNGYYDIEKYFHGARMLVSLNDDAEKIYEGRVSVSAYQPEDNHSTLSLSYDLDAMPIEEAAKRSLIFRIRTIGYTGYITKEQFQLYGTTIIDGKNYNRPYLLPAGAVFSKWDPATPFTVTKNVDIYAKYYFKISKSNSYTTPAMASALSSHPIQYIIEEPEEKTEETYEVPDTIKFLFNNVQYSIDVLGEGGKTEKRLWYTPNNFEIETETTQ